MKPVARTLDLASFPHYRLPLSAWGGMTEELALRRPFVRCRTYKASLLVIGWARSLDSVLEIILSWALSPALPSCQTRPSQFAAPTASKVPISKSCPPLQVETGTGVNSAVMSYFRTIHRSSVSARGVLTSTVPKCDMTGTASFAFLRCQPHVELNSNFVFGLDARFSRRLDPEISLLHDGLAGVAAVL
jgi:hypothetical protein